MTLYSTSLQPATGLSTLMSLGFLPAAYSFLAYFIILFYSAGFGSIYATLWSMYRNALKCSDELGLDDVERHATVTSIYNCLVYVAFAALSIALIVITEIPPLAGLVYAGIGPAMFVLHLKRDRDHKKLVRERGLDA